MENILIVDDQPCIRQFISEELSFEGYEVQGAADAEALRRCMRRSRPDLVLLDLYLEETDGFRLLVDIKEKHPDLPVLIFTAYDSYKDDPRLSRADGYLVKSIILDELKATIASILKKQGASQTNVPVNGPAIPNAHCSNS